MISLKKARGDGKLDEFAKERDGDAPGNEEAFNRTLASMAGTSKSGPETSKPGRSGD